MTHNKRVAAFIFSTPDTPSFIATTWEAAKEVSYTLGVAKLYFRGRLGEGDDIFRCNSQHFAKGALRNEDKTQQRKATRHRETTLH